MSSEGSEKINHSGCLLSQTLFTVLFAYVYAFSFYSITPLCPYYVCYNPIMIIFSVDGHHFAFFYMTEHNYSVFCNQQQGSTKVNANLSGNLYGATYFFLDRFARSVFKTLIKCIVQSGTSANRPYITKYSYVPYIVLQQHFIITFTPEDTFFLK